jgi:syntaxin 5
MASTIGKDISSTTLKLSKLAQRKSSLRKFTLIIISLFIVAKRKTLFDDRPVEISVTTPPQMLGL